MEPGHDEGAFYKIHEVTGAKKQVKKARFDLIPVGPLKRLAEHYGHGASHYEDRNWEKGIDWSDIYAAMMRHATDWWGGEDYDKDGFHHLVAVAWYAFALLEYEHTHPELDNRPYRSIDEQEN